MKIKDSKTKYMKMDRIIQVGVVSLGAMLVTGVAVEVDKQKEIEKIELFDGSDTKNQGVLRSYNKYTGEYEANDLFNEDYVPIGEQLMRDVYPIGTKLETKEGTPIYNLEDLDKPLKSTYSNEYLNQSNGAAVYLDENGNKVIADTDYKIIECNGMGYQHFGYLLLNENSKNKWDYEGVYKKESVYKTSEHKEKDIFGDLELESDSISWYTWTEDQVSDLVIRGEYGNGEERKQRLEEAGYNYENIQSLVNLKSFNQDYTVYASEFIFDSDKFFPDNSLLGRFPTYVFSDTGTLEINGSFVNYLDENGDLRTSYYDVNGELLSDFEDKEQGYAR